MLRRMLAAVLSMALLAGCAGTPAPGQATQAVPLTAGSSPTPVISSPTPPPTQTRLPTQAETASQEAAQAPSPTHAAVPTGAGGDFPAEVTERILQVEQNLVPILAVMGADPQPMDLLSRMAYFQVPGVSIAVVNEGRVEWAKGYGVIAAGSDQPVTPETLFQAASISKPVTALGVMKLAQDGMIDLDQDVNELLTTWQVPEDELTAVEKVTARRLLSHTAGMTVHGFSGYSYGSELPTAAQTLSGQPPANNAAVRVATTPGSGFDYSGGGYVLLQQLMVDRTGQPFDAWMAQNVFEPLEMDASFYAPLPVEQEGRAAVGHTFDGTPLDGRWRVHPELGPAGLWSTPGDLAKVLIEIGAADQGRGSLLTQQSAAEMLQPVMENNSLGLVVPGNGAVSMFGHGGSNAGYRTLMFAVRGGAGGTQGAVVMTNGDNGMELVFEIFRAIAQVYDWPEVEGWRPGETHRAGFVEVAPEVLAGYAGQYQMDGLTFDVAAEGDQLFLRIPSGGPAYRLFPDNDTDFFTADGAQFIFNGDGTLQMNGWGEAVETARKVQP